MCKARTAKHHKNCSGPRSREIKIDSWARVDMEFLFECLTRQLTSEIPS